MQTTFENKSLTGREKDICFGNLLYSYLSSFILIESSYLSNKDFPKTRTIAKNPKSGKLLKRTGKIGINANG